MFFSFLLAAVCAIPFLAAVLLILLLFISLDRALYEKRPVTSSVCILDDFLSGIRRQFYPHKYLYFACLVLLMVYLLLPVGSLKPYLDTPTDTIFIAALLLLAQSLYIKGIKKFSAEMYLTLEDSEYFSLPWLTISLLTAGSSLAFYMLARGIPGDIFSLESVTAMPLWTVVEGPGAFGLVCFFLLFAVTCPGRGADFTGEYREFAILEVYSAVRYGLGPVLAVSIFFPWNPSVWLNLYGGAMFSLDFAFFWLKVFLLQFLVFPAIRKVYVMIEDRLPADVKYIVPATLGLAGAAAFYADYLRG